MIPGIVPFPSYDWKPRTSTLALRPGEVHIWRWQLDQQRDNIQNLCHYLDQEEVRRAQRFRFCRDRERFIAAHGMVRVILGGYLDIPPAHLEFDYGPFGKPELDPRACPNPLSFNVSHSDGLALLAATAEAQVGIDVERLKLDLTYEEIAERFFSPREITMLRELPVEMRAEAFFHGWTRKEAYVKARGYGLSFPFDRFTVSVDPDAAELLDVIDDPQDRERWYLHSLGAGAGYVAALAVEQAESTILYRDA